MRCSLNSSGRRVVGEGGAPSAPRADGGAGAGAALPGVQSRLGTLPRVALVPLRAPRAPFKGCVLLVFTHGSRGPFVIRPQLDRSPDGGAVAEWAPLLRAPGPP